jgi:acetolactate synthase II small subunit
MIHRLCLRLKSEPGAVQRVIVVASKRGFEPVGIDVRRDGEHFHMELSVESEKPKTLLVRTLGRLFDVESVE